MVELKLNISEVDFDAAIQLFAGSGAVGSAAVMAAKLLSDAAKEELAVKYLNANSDKLAQMLESAADRKGVHIRVSDAQANIV